MKTLKLTLKHKKILTTLGNGPRAKSQFDDRDQPLISQLLRANLVKEESGRLSIVPNPMPAEPAAVE